MRQCPDTRGRGEGGGQTEMASGVPRATPRLSSEAPSRGATRASHSDGPTTPSTL